MIQLALTSIALAFLFWIASINAAHDHVVLHDARVVLTSRQIEQLSTFGSAYAQSHTSANGPVALSTAGAPAWYAAPPGALLVVQAGTSYACMTSGPVPDRAAVLGAIRAGGMVAGISSGASLTDGIGNTIATLPAGIPANDLCVIQ